LPGDAPLGAGEGLVAEAGDLRGIANMWIPPRGERRLSTNPGMGDSVGIGCSCMCVFVCAYVCVCVCVYVHVFVKASGRLHVRVGMIERHR